ncbi:MAG: ArsR family transcriptional regulator [Nanoarchaeota archaeon]|nr:ArsR family transcriptional regulator [Nanoarchaeota archaeon]
MHLFNSYEKHIIELLIQQEKTLPELSSAIGISKPATSKYLKKLEEQHIIKGTYQRNKVGRTIQYQLQPFHIVFSIDPITKILINFTTDESINTEHLYLGYIQQKEFRNEVSHYLKEILTTSDQKFVILLYGSVAQGSAHRKSDIDLLLLKTQWQKPEKDEILNLIAKASYHCTHQAKPLFKNIQEFENMDASIQKQIKEHAIILYEKGIQWDYIKNQLTRYKSIMI